MTWGKGRTLHNHSTLSEGILIHRNGWVRAHTSVLSSGMLVTAPPPSSVKKHSWIEHKEKPMDLWMLLCLQRSFISALWWFKSSCDFPNIATISTTQLFCSFVILNELLIRNTSKVCKKNSFTLNIYKTMMLMEGKRKPLSIFFWD